MECLRGANAGTVAWYIAIAPFMLATLILLASLALVLKTVVDKERQSRRFAFRPATRRKLPELTEDDLPPANEEGTERQEDQADTKCNDNWKENYSDRERKAVSFSITEDDKPDGLQSSAQGHATTTTTVRPSKTRTEKMAQEVTKRCLFYGIVFLNTFLWTSISMIVHNKEPPEWNSFWLGCLAFIFMPLQGFLNFVIYISPRYKQERKKDPESKRLWALWRSVCNPNGGRVSSTGHSCGCLSKASMKLTAFSVSANSDVTT
jgi:hypothetical protein